MARVNFFDMPVPEPAVETETYTENGQTLTLSFREADAGDLALAAEDAMRLSEDYLTGSETRAPAPFPYPDVKPSRILFNNVAVAQRCQVGTEYTEIEFLLMSARMPKSWLKVQGRLQEMLRRSQADPKEGPPAAPTA